MKTLQEKILILRRYCEKMRIAYGLPDSVSWQIYLEDSFSSWKDLIEMNLCSPRDFLEMVEDKLKLMKGEKQE